MTHLLLCLGYGDAVITLSLARAAGLERKLNIVCGSIGADVIQTLGFSPMSVSKAFGGYPELFDARGHSISEILKSVRELRLAIDLQTRPGDVLICEKRDVRYHFIRPAKRVALQMPPDDSSIYRARARMFEQVTGNNCFLPGMRRLTGRALTALINPNARQDFKALDAGTLMWLVKFLSDQKVRVTLIDAEERFPYLKDQVPVYVPKQPLSVGVSYLESADVYIGPDSLFIHLAVFLNKPIFLFTHPGGRTFIPPGLSGENCFPLAETPQRSRLTESLLRFLEPPAQKQAR